MSQLSFHSPIGDLTLSAEHEKIVSLDWGWTPTSRETPFLCTVKQQIDAYFNGEKPTFSVALNPWGSPFQQKVWQALNTIPYGQTVSYGDLAAILDTHPRAIGGACGRNPIPILIPCHRVVAKDGRLTGYSGGAGIETKAYLIRLEQATL